MIVVGYNDTGRFEVLSPSGERHGTVRTRLPVSEISPADRRYAEERFLAWGGYPLPRGLENDWSDHLDYILSEGPRPEAMPLVDAVRVSREGLVWMRRFSLRPSESHTWEVHSTARGFLATIEMASAMEVLEIGADYVLGVEEDALEVEHLVRYRIEGVSSSETGRGARGTGRVSGCFGKVLESHP